MKLESYWTASAPAFVPRAARAAGAVRRRDRRRRLHRAVGGAGAGTARRVGRRARSRRARRCRGLGAQRRPRQQRARGRLCRGGRQGRRRARARLVPRLRRCGRQRSSASCATKAIDCDFVRHGKLKLATRPAQLEALSRSAERLVRDGVDSDVEILDAARVRAEVASDRFVGGLLYKRSGQMHMGRFAHGLAQAAERRGAQIHTGTCVQRLERLGAASGAPRAHQPRQRAGAAGAAGQRRGAAWRLWQLRLAAPAHRADRQLHRRDRAAGRRARERAAARAPHLRDGRQHPPLLPPHARPPAGVRRARALRVVNPHVGRDERRDPARRHGRDFPSLRGRRHRLLLGRPGRRDAGPPAACRRARRPVLFHRLQRPRHADVGADGRAHGRGDGRRCVRQPVARPRRGARSPATSGRRGSCPRWACISA